MRGTWPSLRGGKDTPSMVGVNTTTLGAIAGHEAPGGQRRGEEQPPTAQTPIASAAASPARRTVTLLGRTAARTGCSQQSAGVPFIDSTVPACPLRARLGGESGRTAVTPGQAHTTADLGTGRQRGDRDDLPSCRSPGRTEQMLGQCYRLRIDADLPRDALPPPAEFARQVRDLVDRPADSGTDDFRLGRHLAGAPD